MESCQNLLSISNIIESEKFIRRHCNVDSVEDLLQQLLRNWTSKWNDFDDVAAAVHTKVIEAFEVLCSTCINEDYLQGLQISLECLILNKLHDHIIPLLYFKYCDEDKSFYTKCKRLCDLDITAEQVGAPEDYAIPLAAAVVEFASLDVCKSPTEKIHCLCTTFDLVFAELKSAIVEIISTSKDENNIPIIENRDIIPILMIVIIKSKLVHIYSNMYYIEKFLWKLQEAEHVQNIISIFKNAITEVESINDGELRPSSGRIRRDLDLAEMTDVLSGVESPSANQSESLVENYNKRFAHLIVTSISNTYINNL